MPLRAGLSMDVVNWGFWFFFEMIVDIYFWIDLVLNFRTGYWRSNGTLEVDPLNIKWNYIKSWFVLDALSCLPVNYITLFDSSMKDLKAFKSIRLLRLFKLLRLARIKRIIQRHGDGSLQAYVGLGMTLFGILFAAHMLACFWFLVGTLGRTYKAVGDDGTVVSTELKGWVAQDELWCTPETGICELELIDEHIGWSVKYVRAMYTVFENDVAHTEAEWFVCRGC